MMVWRPSKLISQRLGLDRCFGHWVEASLVPSKSGHLDIFCQQLWNVVQLGGVCDSVCPSGTWLGDVHFLRYVFVLLILLDIFCQQLQNFMSLLGNDFEKNYLMFVSTNFHISLCGVKLALVSNWYRCQIDSFTLLVSNWSGVKLSSNPIICMFSTIKKTKHSKSSL